MKFEGFDRRALELLPQLPAMTQTEYKAVQPLLKSGLQDPARVLIEEVAARLDAALTVGKASLSPMHRDLRFANPGTPRYKDHLLLTTWQGTSRKTAPTLWLHIGPGLVGFQSSVPLDGGMRERFREQVAGTQGGSLKKAVERVINKHQASAELAGGQYKRVPAPWDEHHPQEALLRCKGFQLRYSRANVSNLGHRGLVQLATAGLRELMPVHRWLVEHLSV